MIAPVKKQKKVAVIGGGPAGMRCGLYLAERGHLVTICSHCAAGDAFCLCGGNADLSIKSGIVKGNVLS